MTLRAAIQFPIQQVLSFEIVLKAYEKLARTFILGHAAMQHPLSLRLVPQGRYFLGEIWVPLVGRHEIERALELLVSLDEIYLRAHPQELPLYKSGIVYGSANKIPWFTAPLLYDAKKGDCKDLSALRVAQLRLAGERGAKCYLKAVNRLQWHVQVQRANGTIEDPSEKLGMKEYFRARRD